jgi:hypothetical protein
MTWEYDHRDFFDRGETELGLTVHKAIDGTRLRIKFGQRTVVIGHVTIRVQAQGTMSEKVLPSHVFQYGPRAWKSGNLNVSSYQADYEQSLLQMAAAFEKLDWTKLAADLFDATVHQIPSESPVPVDYLFVRQDQDWLLVIRDPATDLAVVYKIGPKQIQLLGCSHPSIFGDLDSAPYRPVRSLAEGPRKGAKKGDRAGAIEELRQEVEWRFGTHLLHKSDLIPLLVGAGERMADLGQNVALAYSASRFNDARHDEGWTAVRVDDVSWENGSYFGGSGPLSLFRISSVLHTAVGLLHHLLACGLVDCIVRTFGVEINPSDAVGLFLQDSHFYLAWSSSDAESGDGPVYEIDIRMGGIKLVGLAPRFDWEFNTRDSRSGRGVPADKCLEWMGLDEWLECIRTGDTKLPSFPDPGQVFWMPYMPSDAVLDG